MGCDSSTAVQAHESSYLPPLRKKEAPQPIVLEKIEDEAVVSGKQECLSLLKKAEACYSESDYSGSLSLCEEILGKDPEFHRAWNQMGLSYYYMESYSQSVNAYQKAIEIDSNNDRYWYNCGKSYYYLENYPKSIQCYQRAISIKKKPHYYYDCGRSHYYNYQYNEAIAKYREGVQMVDGNQKVKFYHQIGQCYYWVEDYNKAILELNQGLKIDKDHHSSMNFIGLCSYYQSNYTEAEVWYRLALKQQPNKVSYLWNLARNHYWKEEYDQAIEVYQKCIQLSPKDGSYEAQVSKCYFYKVDYPAALEWIDRAIEKTPKGDFYYKKGYIYYYMEDYEESHKWYGKCMELEPQHYNSQLGTANSFYYSENYNEAIKFYKKCLDIKPNNTQVYERMGKSYYYLKEYQQALKYFEQVIKLKPSYIEPYILKGRCYFNSGSYQESLEMFKKAKSITESIKKSNPQNYTFYIHTINQEIHNTQSFIIKAKLGVISKEDKEDVQRMRKSFENKIEKMFVLEVSEDGGKKQKKEKQISFANRDILEIVKQLYQKEELYHFTQKETLQQITAALKRMFLKDYGYFQILAYIFGIFVWVSRFKKQIKIQEIEDQLSKKIREISKSYPPTLPNFNADLSVEFPLFPEKKINLFTSRKYFDSYTQLISQIEKVNGQSQSILVLFKELLFQLEKESSGFHAMSNLKLPLREQSVDETKYQQKLFKVLIRIFEKMFKDELATKKEYLLMEIEQEISSRKKMTLQEIIVVMMNKWIGYIDAALKERKQNQISTECYISDLVRGKCMYKTTEGIKAGVCSTIRICKEKGYQITELDNRLLKQTQDVVLKIKINNIVCQLQLPLQFDGANFEFGHSFYEIERCSLGCIFGCSLFLTKDVNETFPQLLMQNEKATKKNREGDIHKAIEFVMKSFRESVQS